MFADYRSVTTFIFCIDRTSGNKNTFKIIIIKKKVRTKTMWKDFLTFPNIISNWRAIIDSIAPFSLQWRQWWI